MKTYGTVITIQLLLLSYCVDTSAQVKRFVNRDAAGTNSGADWTNAYTNLQTAINASSAGDSVFVRKGIYTLNASIKMKEGVKIYGSFSGTENFLWQRSIGSSANDSTILNGNNAVGVISNVFSSSVPLSSAALLDGFFITGGNSSGDGGGMRNSYASPTLSNLIISGNTTADRGGGIYNYSGSPILTNVRIVGNKTLNNSQYGGGGMFNLFNSNPILTNVVISGNSAANDGGGVFNRSESAPIFTNVLISGNVATNEGGGMYSERNSSPVLTNVTISGNAADKGGAIYHTESNASIRNSVILGNSSGVLVYSGSNSMMYSLVQGNIYTADGNINATGISAADVFINPVVSTAAPTTDGDYRLRNDNENPVVEKGNNGYFATGQTPDLSSITTDLDGNDRLNGTVDMGAFEKQNLVALPDVLLQLKGGASNAGNQLRWQTITERHLEGYAIETAGADLVFEEIHYVPGNGNGNYRFEHQAPLAGANYYRLKIIKKNGSVEYSNVIAIKFVGSDQALQAYPVPVKEVLNLRNVNGYLSIINSAGQVLRHINIPTRQHTTISLSGMQSGIYLLQIKKADGAVTVKKIMKQ